MVSQCLCFKVSFEKLKKIAQKTGAETVEELQEHIRFGMNCQRCHPYVRLMLQTGLTDLPIIPEE